MKRIILHGSAREDGNTAAVAQYISQSLHLPVRSLVKRTIHPFSYTNDYPAEDEFLPLIEEMLEYNEWLLLSPVYWYSMSGPMKIFFDRLSDLLKYRKDLGERLEGKRMWAISCGSEAVETPGFFTPFRLSADYLGMHYCGQLHTWLGRKPVLKPAVQGILDQFIAQLSD